MEITVWNVQKYLHSYQTLTDLILGFVCIFMQLWYLVASGYVNCKSVKVSYISVYCEDKNLQGAKKCSLNIPSVFKVSS